MVFTYLIHVISLCIILTISTISTILFNLNLLRSNSSNPILSYFIYRHASYPDTDREPILLPSLSSPVFLVSFYYIYLCFLFYILFSSPPNYLHIHNTRTQLQRTTCCTANARTEHFAWSIMTSFDAVQALGIVRYSANPPLHLWH